MTKFERQRRSLLICIVMLGLILTSLSAYVYAKYIKNETIKGHLIISAELGDIAVWEHQAVRQTDGSYKLDMTKLALSNSYKLIPGLDIPKDPHVVITNMKTVPVYVFIKVETSLGSGVTYQLADCWKATSVENVYVYAPGGTSEPVISDMNIPILATMPDGESHIQVSQNLNLTGEVQLNFSAAMIQTAAGISDTTISTLFP